MKSSVIDRAQGCLLGQIAGDSLGSLVESRSLHEQALLNYPDGLRDLADGGAWNTLAGQPTDDSELALALARMLVEQGTYSREEARRSYVDWLRSEPFDCGRTTYAGLDEKVDCRNWESQANGALMRISPLGIFGAGHDRDTVVKWAIEDALITHPNVVCRHANAVYAGGIAYAIRTGCSPDEVYEEMLRIADQIAVDPSRNGSVGSTSEAFLVANQTAGDSDMNEVLRDAHAWSGGHPVADFRSRKKGWVLIAFRNAVYQLLHAPNAEEGIVDTVMRGGDTDTNGAIAGALLGAVHGLDAIPSRWVDAISACRPDKKDPRVHWPRPSHYWPTDALELAERLVRGKAE